MEPGCLLLLIAVKMQSAKNTVPKASKNTMKPIGIAFSKPCYLGSAGLSLRAFRHFLHSQHAFLPLLYRRRAIVKLQSANPYLRRDRPACKPPWPSLICMQCSRLTITQPLTPTFTLDIFRSLCSFCEEEQSAHLAGIISAKSGTILDEQLHKKW